MSWGVNVGEVGKEVDEVEVGEVGNGGGLNEMEVGKVRDWKSVRWRGWRWVTSPPLG